MSEQLPDDILMSLGFEQKDSPYGIGKSWTHRRSEGRFFYHFLTPDMVMESLIEIGHSEFRSKAVALLKEIDMDDDNG